MNTEVVAQNVQSIETGNAGHTRKRIQTKQKQTKNEHNVRWTPLSARKQTRALLQTTGGIYDPSFVCMRKSQHGSQNVRTYNRRTQITQKISNTDFNDR